MYFEMECSKRCKNNVFSTVHAPFQHCCQHKAPLLCPSLYDLLPLRGSLAHSLQRDSIHCHLPNVVATPKPAIQRPGLARGLLEHLPSSFSKGNAFFSHLFFFFPFGEGVVFFLGFACFNFVTLLHNTWPFSSRTRDRTHTPCIRSAES